MPRLIDDVRMTEGLAAWGRALPRPDAILVISAHWWGAHHVAIGSTANPVPLYYDFYDFPDRFYQLQWPAPPAREVADRVRQLVDGWRPVVAQSDRGLDHGAFIPLMLMYPDHDIPVVQISQPSLDPAELLDLGIRLRPLRHEGVLVFTTGVLTHHSNVPAGADQEPLPEIVEFDEWLGRRLVEHDLPGLLDYERRGPHVDTVLPTREHFTPLFVALGTCNGSSDVTFPTTGFWYGNSMRSVEFR